MINKKLIIKKIKPIFNMPSFVKIRYIKEWIFTGKELNEEEREPAIKEMEYEKI